MDEGAAVVGFDPYAAANAARECPGLELADDPYDAARGAHGLVLCTDWSEFRELDFPKLSDLVSFPILVDARNFLDPEEIVAAGFIYYSMGRPTEPPAGPSLTWREPSSLGDRGSSGRISVGDWPPKGTA